MVYLDTHWWLQVDIVGEHCTPSDVKAVHSTKETIPRVKQNMHKNAIPSNKMIRKGEMVRHDHSRILRKGLALKTMKRPTTSSEWKQQAIGATGKSVNMQRKNKRVDAVMEQIQHRARMKKEKEIKQCKNETE